MVIITPFHISNIMVSILMLKIVLKQHAIVDKNSTSTVGVMSLFLLQYVLGHFLR